MTIVEQIIELYKQGLEDMEIADKLQIDESFVADTIDIFEGI
jgi:DNA-binding NarL/FixJ family response regulator